MIAAAAVTIAPASTVAVAVTIARAATIGVASAAASVATADLNGTDTVRVRGSMIARATFGAAIRARAVTRIAELPAPGWVAMTAKADGVGRTCPRAIIVVDTIRTVAAIAIAAAASDSTTAARMSV